MKRGIFGGYGRDTVENFISATPINQIFCGHTEVSLLKGMLPCLCISILLGVP